MTEDAFILSKVREKAADRILYLPHAVRQMARPDRMISSQEVRQVIRHGDVIENYPEDPRGHSCLMLGHGNSQRPIHIVCSPKDEYLAIITAYLPDPMEWSEDFTVRKRI